MSLYQKRNSSPVIVMGIDPGTGVSSPTGFSVFNAETKEIYYASNITPTRKELQHRIREISDIFQATVDHIDTVWTEHTIVCCVESFVMRGKGGETLQRLIGSLMGRLPYRFVFYHVQNSTLKLHLAGHGHADKELVAEGVQEYFCENVKSYEIVKELIVAREFDILDSLAIGITGLEMQYGKK